MSQQIDLVLVGYRAPALHAASRLGLRVLLVDANEPTASASRRIVGAVRTPLVNDPNETSAHIQEAIGRTAPRAVLAAGEKGVLIAAALRAAYGLDGVDPQTAYRARDKAQMKAVARAAGIPSTDWMTLETNTTPAALIAGLDLPVVLKQRQGSGTAGLIVARTAKEVAQGLATIGPEARGAWMAERFVKGAEMSIESFIRNGQILFVNPTEYYIPGFASIAPALLSEAEASTIYSLNDAAIRALGITHGMTHLEIYRTEAGPLFGEVAVRPPGGRLMRLLRRAYDIDPWEVVIALELGADLPDLPKKAKRAAGAWMLHPGPGRVVSVRGLAAARRVRGVRKLVCRARAGTLIEARASTGSDVGWLEVRGRDRNEVAARLEEAHGRIKITMAPASEPGASSPR